MRNRLLKTTVRDYFSVRPMCPVVIVVTLQKKFLFMVAKRYLFCMTTMSCRDRGHGHGDRIRFTLQLSVHRCCEIKYDRVYRSIFVVFRKFTLVFNSNCSYGEVVERDVGVRLVFIFACTFSIFLLSRRSCSRLVNTLYSYILYIMTQFFYD